MGTRRIRATIDLWLVLEHEGCRNSVTTNENCDAHVDLLTIEHWVKFRFCVTSLFVTLYEVLYLNEERLPYLNINHVKF